MRGCHVSFCRSPPGVEIREPLVVRANKWAQDAGLGNLFFSFANMNASIRSILKCYPGKISLVTILMPDPWFKSRHHKRRVVQPEFVEALAEHVTRPFNPSTPTPTLDP